MSDPHLPTDRLADALDQAKAALALDPTPANLTAQARALKLFPGVLRAHAEVALHSAWPPNGAGTGFLELFAKAWPEDQPKARKAPSKPAAKLNGHAKIPAEWTRELQVSPSGGLKGNEYNIALTLEHAPELAGALAYDMRILSPIQLRETPAGPPGTWTDVHTARLTIWLQGIDLPAKPSAVQSAVLALSHRNEVDPLKDYLNALKWDGQERIGTWLADYCQAERNSANSIMGSKWLIGAIARALKPGSRMDYMLILEGEQGVRKSTLIRTLGGKYASEHLPDFHSKDSMMIAARYWIIEVSELAAMRKSEIEAVKAFMSRTIDTVRLPYGHAVIDLPRQSVVIGSVNPGVEGYFQDMTGNRRFWPVKVGRVDIEAVAKDRDQLWAEAVECYRRNDGWHIGTDGEQSAVAAQQQEREVTDDWLVPVDKFMRDTLPPIDETPQDWAERSSRSYQVGTTTTYEIATKALNIRPEFISRAVQTRIGWCLKKLGYERVRVRTDYGLKWEYRKK